MRRLVSVLVLVVVSVAFMPGTSEAKKKKRRAAPWYHYAAVMTCDQPGGTTLVAHNPAYWDVPVMVLAAAAPDEEATNALPEDPEVQAGGFLSLDCADLGLSTLSVVAIEGPAQLDVSAISANGEVRKVAERRVANSNARYMDGEDSDSDSDSDDSDDS